MHNYDIILAEKKYFENLWRNYQKPVIRGTSSLILRRVLSSANSPFRRSYDLRILAYADMEQMKSAQYVPVNFQPDRSKIRFDMEILHTCKIKLYAVIRQ